MRKCFASVVVFVAIAACNSVPVRGADAPASRPAWAKVVLAEAHLLAVQHEGRTMPLNTFGTEIVVEVTGRDTYERYQPLNLLFAWTWQPEAWRDEPMVLVGHPALQKQLGLPGDAKRFRYDELMNNQALMAQIMAVEQGALRSPNLTAEQQASLQTVAQVGQRLKILKAAFEGDLIRLVPPIGNPDGAWVTVADIDAQPNLPVEARQKIQASWVAMREAFLAGDKEGFRAAAKDIKASLEGLQSPAYPSPRAINVEVLYNLVHPFRYGWYFTLAAMLVGLVRLVYDRKWLRYIAWMLLIDGFALLTMGLAMRWIFGGHAPVATMYESLVFMGWGVVAIGIVTMIVVRQKAALPIVAAVATAILAVGDMAPLQSTAGVLMPALTGTMWLSFHVKTIMLAYSAFALAMGLGHVQSILLVRRASDPQRTAALGRLLYGMTLFGVVLLTAGIIFGAIWAGKAWGRYWGFDPKETWSLITLLGYMVVLHGRRAGWFGAFGLAISSILCFLLVIMTYYGVNFVLGEGLHSYGRGSGGQLWVGLYALLEIVFVGGVWLAHARKGSSPPTRSERQSVVGSTATD